MLDLPSALFSLTVLCSSTATLGMRHDVDPSRYVELGATLPAVVQIGGLASGTLVASDWILTVAHGPELIGRMRPGAPLTASIGGEEYEIARTVVPEKRGLEGDRHDIALLQLARPVPDDIAPLGLWLEDVEPGTKFVLAGWGISATGDQGVEFSPQVMSAPTRALRAGWNEVERVGEKQELLHARFDGPELGLELEASPCIGDSGGPALVRVEGDAGTEPSWRVAGVLAAIDDGDGDRVLSEYSEEFAMTRVGAYAEWIEATIGR